MRTSGWDLTKSQAEIHEEYLVPSIYAQWATRLTAMAEIDAGHTVLDLGCGTGILARKAAEEVGFTGKVTGLDVDQEMLQIAAQRAPQIEWRNADASALPFSDGSFDRVVSQFLLPHVKNRVSLLKEMYRVIAPGGKLVIAVWAPIHYSPAFNALVQVTRTHGNTQAAELLALPWETGHENMLGDLIYASGAATCTITREKGTARFPGPDAILELWVNRSPVRQLLDDNAYEKILHHGRQALEAFAIADGSLVCAMNATVAVVDKP